jgi:transglutaminase-like putative cysteine protease
MKSGVLLLVAILFFIAQPPGESAPAREDMAPYLKPGIFVDCDHPGIVTRARALTAACRSEAEKAKALFEYVRDTHNHKTCESFKASDVLLCGGNYCRQRSILLAALCRAAGIPARLQLQKVTLKGWRDDDGKISDLVFAHGITGIFLGGRWRLYESVGNGAKWIVWTQDARRGKEMPVPFYADRDCLFRPEERIVIETLPDHFADRTDELVALIERIDGWRKF